jgi:hypothetical protein
LTALAPAALYSTDARVLVQASLTAWSKPAQAMSDDLDRARDSIDAAAERQARGIAVLISVLAAALAIAEMQEKGAQNAYMTSHIQVSDDYAFYQAKTVRSNLYVLHAETLAALPSSADPAMSREIADARAMAARLDDDQVTKGRKQLLEQAHHHEDERQRHFERYERLEYVVGALQIAIVLASMSVVTRVLTLAVGAGVLGAGAAAVGVLVAAGRM